MRRKFFLFAFVLVYLFIIQLNSVQACNSCGCALSRIGTETKSPIESNPWLINFSFEHQNWDEIPAAQAHELHHDGHHIHDKTYEEFYHLGIGSHPTERFTAFLEIPFVVREQINIHSDEALGEKEKSEGIGDLQLTGIYRFLSQENSFLGPVIGIKFPTGQTSEKASDGDEFELEMQPGSGSFDYIVGAAFRYDIERFSIRGNSLYTFRTEGDHDFEFGDLFTSYIFMNYLINPGCHPFKIRPGIDLNLQVENKQEEAGEEIEDSGSTTLFIGPALMLDVTDHVSLLGNVLFPAYQDMGGVHQERDFIINLGVKISW